MREQEAEETGSLSVWVKDGGDADVWQLAVLLLGAISILLCV